MAVQTLRLIKNDLQPYYSAQVKDSDGTVVDITSATIYCTMKSSGGTLKIDRQTTGISITDATNGKFEYQWQSGDTDTVDSYEIEFEIDPSSGGKFTLPNPGQGPGQVVIADSLDTV
jgi:hypothetical protein